MDLRQIAQALGGNVTGRQVLAPGPGHSPRDRSLAVRISNDAPDGFIVHSFANDDWRECRAHVADLLGGRAVRGKAIPRQMVAPDNLASGVRIWNEAIDPRVLRVLRYFERRCLELSDDIAGRVVRFHPDCPWRRPDGTPERRPCMVTAFRSIADDSLQAIQRTAITDEGQKIGRLSLGPMSGAAIKIDVDEDVEQGLTIGEGFETCVAARQLGFRPIWALGSARAIEAFPVLSGIDALTILAETDDKGANLKAVRACGNRWASADREVIVATPRVGGDMNDALRVAP
jgi:putative DNA primase/helicase